MKKIICVLSAAIVAAVAMVGAAHAKCITNDAWTGPDKVKHLGAGVVIGSAGTLVFKDADKGFLLGLGVAAAKEAWDTRQANHTCSLQDFAVTAAGAAAGAYGTGWFLLPERRGVQVAFARVF